MGNKETTKTFEERVRDVFDTVDIVYGSQEDAIQLILEAHAEELREIKDDRQKLIDMIDWWLIWDAVDVYGCEGELTREGKKHSDIIQALVGLKNPTEVLNEIIDKKIGGENV